jgi:pimeloyl-ACP methyl ester carboxylesterase
MRRILATVAVMVLGGWLYLGAQQAPPPSVALSPEQKAAIDSLVKKLDETLAPLRAKKTVDRDLLNDVEVYLKAGRMMQEFPEEFFAPADIPNGIAVLEQGLSRAEALRSGVADWMKSPGRRIHGFRSAMDGSIQPYGLRIPASYDGSKPVRLYVWLHGRDARNTEAGFIHRFQRPGANHSNPADEQQIQLDLYGRWNGMAWHWTGESDIFEGIADVQRRYKIDPKRIILRGFSMGGCGAWHIALHHPGTFAAAEIGAGTWPYRSQIGGFAEFQRGPLHIYENILDWSLNAFNFPLAGHGGELEAGTSSIPAYAPKGAKTRGQLESSIRVRETLAREGYASIGADDELQAQGTEATFYISQQTGHSTSPAVRAKLDAFLKKYGDRGIVSPDHVRFVSWTTRYNRAHWVTVDGLGRHYERAEVDATRSGKQMQVKTSNVTRLTLRETAAMTGLEIDGQKLALRPAGQQSLEKLNGAWRLASAPVGLRKQHRQQGPIDDAFMDPFLLVQPTGTPWNEAVHAQSLETLKRFQAIYAKHLRAHPRVKNDKDVTAADFANYNVVLFGDPGSNSWIAKLQGKLPLTWTRESVQMAGQTFPAKDHYPALIYPSPLSKGRYVVLNSGMTFDEAEIRHEYQMPRLGDYAVLKLGGPAPSIELGGLFNEAWK